MAPRASSLLGIWRRQPDEGFLGEKATNRLNWLSKSVFRYVVRNPHPALRATRPGLSHGSQPILRIPQGEKREQAAFTGNRSDSSYIAGCLIAANAAYEWAASRVAGAAISLQTNLPVAFSVRVGWSKSSLLKTASAFMLGAHMVS